MRRLCNQTNAQRNAAAAAVEDASLSPGQDRQRSDDVDYADRCAVSLRTLAAWFMARPEPAAQQEADMIFSAPGAGA